MPTLTIELTTNQAQALAQAIGELRRLSDEEGAPRPATVAEVRLEVVTHLKNLHRDAANARARAATQELDLT